MADLKDENPLLALPENFISFVKSNEFLTFLESIYIYCYVKQFLSNFSMFLGIFEIGKKEKAVREGSPNCKVYFSKINLKITLTV